MDTTKWKSILVPIDIYHRIREIAQLEHRPIGSQLRLIFSEHFLIFFPQSRICKIYDYPCLPESEVIFL